MIKGIIFDMDGVMIDTEISLILAGCGQLPRKCRDAIMAYRQF